MLKETWEGLDGKKTYIMAAAGALVAFFHLIGAIDYEATMSLLAIFGFGAVGAGRHAYKKGK